MVEQWKENMFLHLKYLDLYIHTFKNNICMLNKGHIHVICKSPKTFILLTETEATYRCVVSRL